MGEIQYPTIEDVVQVLTDLSDPETPRMRGRTEAGMNDPVEDEIERFNAARSLCIKIIGSHLDFDKYSSCPSAACDAVIYHSQFILELVELHDIIKTMFNCEDEDIVIETERSDININHNNTWHVGGRYSKSFKNLKNMLERNGRRVIGVYIRGQSLREVFNNAYREMCSFGISLDFVITNRDFIP